MFVVRGSDDPVQVYFTREEIVILLKGLLAIVKASHPDHEDIFTDSFTTNSNGASQLSYMIICTYDTITRLNADRSRARSIRTPSSKFVKNF